MASVPRRRNASKPTWRTASTQDYDLKEIEDEHGLTPKQVEAFREVFNLFDINGGGTIDAEELDSALKTVDIHLTHAEIQNVLMVIDEDGNGEIDFDEFLTLMTSTEKFLCNLRGGNPDEQKESLFFTALTKFMRKSALSSLTEIERYYNSKVRKSPHVVGHYAAGARLIGLTEKQMAKHLATLSVTGGENNDSPYAQPVAMFTSNIRSKMLNKRKGNGKIRLMVVKPGENLQEACNSDSGEENGSTDNERPGNTDSAEQPHTSELDSLPADVKPKLGRSRQSPLQSPLRLRPTSVSLPAVSVKTAERKNPNMLTIEDMPLIRQKVQMAYESYCREKEDFSHSYYFTDVSAIPVKLQQQFKQILEAYSFKPTNVPHELQLQHMLRPWKLL